jgi:chemotaxis protein methyltransferase CheR
VSITASEFASIRDLVKERAAIVLDEGKEYLVEAMTTNETSFFRDPGVFESLRGDILPWLVKDLAGRRRLAIWSAACSTGQELYSVSMLLHEHFPEVRSWQVKLLGTDLSSVVLERARAGVYTQFEVNRGLPARLLASYFERQGMNWRISARLRDGVEFRTRNLTDASPLPSADLVLLRNVVIYFDPDTRRHLLERIRAALSPGGCLLAGSSESPLLTGIDFERVELGRTVCYRKR